MHPVAPRHRRPSIGRRSLAWIAGAGAAALLVVGIPGTSRGDAATSDAGASAEHPSGHATHAAPGDAKAPTEHEAKETKDDVDHPAFTGRCREQEPQEFLVRGSWFPSPHAPKETIVKAKEMQERAIRYRTEQYGYFEGFGRPAWNKHPPSFYARATKFMGLPVRLNEKILPALACVERALRENPALMAYHPEALSGLRTRNTYRGGEVSNHVYGIAIDIDPQKNTCCGCVLPWSKNPLCTKKVASDYDRMAMPKGWVETFERYGFYWLGHDVLRDTMHFEFLGDPDRIVR